MKYFLVIGLNYQGYKEPAKITIYTGDRLLDSFDLHETTLDALPKENQLYPEFVKKFQKDLTQWPAPQYYKVYKVDGAEIGNNFNLKITNSYTNYTNGFMTKSAMIQFRNIALFPESMCHNNCEALFTALDKLSITCETADKRYRNDKRFSGKPVDDQTLNTQIIPEEKLDSFKDMPHATWPALRWLRIHAIKNRFVKDGLYPDEYWIGGDFDVNIQVKEKYGIKYLHSLGTKTHGIWNYTNSFFVIACAKNLLNIYNENQ